MRYLFSVVILVGVAILVYVMSRNDSEPAPQRVEQVVEISDPVEVETSQVKHPVPVETGPVVQEPQAIPEPEQEIVKEDEPEPITEPDPLPVLDNSDQYMETGLTSLFDSVFITQLVNFNSLVRNIVITVDNLTAARLPVKFRFLTPVEGRFMVVKEDPEDDVAVIDPENYARYIPFVKMLEFVDFSVLNQFYFTSYPLFQQAYEELGYPDKYFNDRLVEVIDHLLQTPQVSDPVALSQPKVFYTFSDPGLESLSSGQKILLRIGTDNSSRVKTRLRAFRAHITQMSE